MALFLKDPNGKSVSLRHVSLCSEELELVYLDELLGETGVYEFYSQCRANRPRGSNRQNMSYEKLANRWRRFGRRFSAEGSKVAIRMWDSRKLLNHQHGQSVGVIALLLEIERGSDTAYVGYFGTLPELVGSCRKQ